jgi:putative transcriptional regulator
MTKPTTSHTRHGIESESDDSEAEEPVLGTDWARLEAMTPEEALQNALDDPDSQPLTPEQRARFRRVPNPQKIRTAMGLTQEQFARRFEIALGTLRDWEQGVRLPDSTAKAYLRVIEQNPEAVAEALSRTYRSKTHGLQ